MLCVHTATHRSADAAWKITCRSHYLPPGPLVRCVGHRPAPAPPVGAGRPKAQSGRLQSAQV